MASNKNGIELMKLSQFVADFLAEKGLSHVFMVTGGGAMHLNDAFAKHAELNTIFMHHEQACAMAAEGFARMYNKPAIVNVTSGPGGVNALNGVFGAWTDSIPMIVISGQVRSDTTMQKTGFSQLRQLGDQECDIVQMVKGITKYAVMIENQNDIAFHLEKAFYLATEGRPGPVWLDIPVDIQGKEIDVSQLMQCDDNALCVEKPVIPSDVIIRTIIEKIESAQRPVIIVGSGVRLSGSEKELLTLLTHLPIPVVTAFNAHDVVEETHPSYVGRPGTIGNRSGNFAVQSADLVLILGCRLNIRQISYQWQSFAKNAYKIMVDIDAAEMQKPTLNIDMKVHAHLHDFMSAMLDVMRQSKVIKEARAPATASSEWGGVKSKRIEKKSWLAWCKQRLEKYPVVLPEYWDRTVAINPYCFMQKLSDALLNDSIVVAANATACICAFQTVQIKLGQRLFSNSGSASMGYGLPAAIGACFAANKKPTVCLEGDGSIMMNLQELSTVAKHQLPLKIFLLNNQGYHSIRQTQQNFFGEPKVGVDENSGLHFPDFKLLAAAFGIAYQHCHHHDELEDVIQKTMQCEGPVLCEVVLTTEQPFAPKLSARRLPDGQIVSPALDDMFPFLSEAELNENRL